MRMWGPKTPKCLNIVCVVKACSFFFCTVNTNTNRFFAEMQILFGCKSKFFSTCQNLFFVLAITAKQNYSQRHRCGCNSNWVCEIVTAPRMPIPQSGREVLL